MKTARPVASPDTETAERPAPTRLTGEAGGAVRRPVIRPRSQPAPGLSSTRSGVRGIGLESGVHGEIARDLAIADTAEIFVAPLLDSATAGQAPSVARPRAEVAASQVAPGAPADTLDVELSPGDRRRRRRRRRRLVHEQLLILLVLVVALAVTVALLASQWLLNGSVSP